MRLFRTPASPFPAPTAVRLRSNEGSVPVQACPRTQPGDRSSHRPGAVPLAPDGRRRIQRTDRKWTTSTWPNSACAESGGTDEPGSWDRRFLLRLRCRRGTCASWVHPPGRPVLAAAPSPRRLRPPAGLHRTAGGTSLPQPCHSLVAPRRPAPGRPRHPHPSGSIRALPPHTRRIPAGRKPLGGVGQGAATVTDPAWLVTVCQAWQRRMVFPAGSREEEPMRKDRAAARAGARWPAGTGARAPPRPGSGAAVG